MKEAKLYTVRKTIRVTLRILARSARQAVFRAEGVGDISAEVSTTGWWCRKDRK